MLRRKGASNLNPADIFDIIKQAGGAWVFYRPVGGIGDAIMLLPAITALKEQVGDDLVIVCCVGYIEPVFRNHHAVDYIISYDQAEIDSGVDRKELGILRDLGCVIFMYYHPCPAAVYEAKYCPYVAKSRQQIFCETAGVEFDMDNYRLELSEEELAISKELMLNDRYIVVHPRSHDKWRDYPYTKWLLRELVRWGLKLDFEVVTIDSVDGLRIKGVRHFSGMALRQAFGLIANAQILIGPDSMAVHASGALGINTLGLYGPTNPQVRLKYPKAHWLPLFRRCHRQYCWYQPCRWRFCLSTVKPKYILQEVSKVLEREAGK